VILKQFLTSQSKSLIEKAALTAEFVMENPSNKVKWHYFYTSENDKAMDFIRNFGEHEEKLDMHKADVDIEFIPHIVTYSCPTCDSD